VIQRELDLFAGSGPDGDRPGGAFAGRPRLAAANKIDAIDDPGRLERLRERLARDEIPLYPISAVTGAGVPALLEGLWRVISRGAGEDDA